MIAQCTVCQWYSEIGWAWPAARTGRRARARPAVRHGSDPEVAAPGAPESHGLANLVRAAVAIQSEAVRGTKAAWDGRRPDASELDGPPFDPRAEGCSVTVHHIGELLGDNGVAWRWESDRRGAGSWIPVRGSDVRPGMALMLEAHQGGYDVRLGWTGRRGDVVPDLPPPGRGGAWDDERETETGYWASLASHLTDAEEQARHLVRELDLPEDLRRSVIDTARFHDLGKAHPVWQAALPSRPGAGVLAKCPPVLAVTVEAARRDAVRTHVEALLGSEAEPLESGLGGGDETLRWALRQKLTRAQMQELRTLGGVMRARHAAFRPGLRHEVASALAMWGRAAGARLVRAGRVPCGVPPREGPDGPAIANG